MLGVAACGRLGRLPPLCVRRAVSLRCAAAQSVPLSMAYPQSATDVSAAASSSSSPSLPPTSAHAEAFAGAHHFNGAASSAGPAARAAGDDAGDARVLPELPGSSAAPAAADSPWSGLPSTTGTDAAVAAAKDNMYATLLAAHGDAEPGTENVSQLFMRQYELETMAVQRTIERYRDMCESVIQVRHRCPYHRTLSCCRS